MNPEIALILGCAGLGFVIAFALWGFVRNTLLEADILALRDKLDAMAAAKGLNDTHVHLSYRKLFFSVLPLAQRSLASMMLNHWLTRNTDSPKVKVISLDERVEELTPAWHEFKLKYPDIVKEIAFPFAFRLVAHTLLWPPNLFLIVCLLIFPSSPQLTSWLSSFQHLAYSLQREASPQH